MSYVRLLVDTFNKYQKSAIALLSLVTIVLSFYVLGDDVVRQLFYILGSVLLITIVIFATIVSVGLWLLDKLDPA